MQDALYQARIVDHYKHPRNKRVIADATIVQKGANPSCGDVLTLYVSLDKGRVTDVAFDGIGCAISQAATSLLTERLVGMTHEEVAALTDGDVYALLGVDITAGRQQCALLPLRTLHAALKSV